MLALYETYLFPSTVHPFESRPDFVPFVLLPVFMTILIVLIVVGLVAWALRLMERALVNQEFSLMLAGFLVASSAAAMMGVYFLMTDYMLYVNQLEGSAMFYSGNPEYYATELVPDISGELPSPHL